VLENVGCAVVAWQSGFACDGASFAVHLVSVLIRDISPRKKAARAGPGEPQSPWRGRADFTTMPNR
jgi:hypothetical protein